MSVAPLFPRSLSLGPCSLLFLLPCSLFLLFPVFRKLRLQPIAVCGLPGSRCGGLLDRRVAHSR